MKSTIKSVLTRTSKRADVYLPPRARSQNSYGHGVSVAARMPRGAPGFLVLYAVGYHWPSANATNVVSLVVVAHRRVQSRAQHNHHHHTLQPFDGRMRVDGFSTTIGKLSYTYHPFSHTHVISHQSSISSYATPVSFTTAALSPLEDYHP